MGPVVEPYRIDAPEVDGSKKGKGADFLIGDLEIPVVLLENEEGLFLLIQSAEAHGSGLIQVAEDSHPGSISKR